ncbi:BTB/POZ protein [Pavlovales sp. CCMP2436]|nr:BTB/POZ protein [Pavlovales sp. CCMP2436]
MEHVRLNVGGVRYETTRTTLTQYAGSYFSAMFGGLHPAAEDEDGCVFIDRDGNSFRHVLNYMRTGSVSLPQHRDDAKAVLVELAYYGLSVPSDDSSHAVIPDFTRQELQSSAHLTRASSPARNSPASISPSSSSTSASLSGSLLQHSDLQRARLVGASCQASDFKHADLRSADLTNANLSNADLRNARIDTMLPTAIHGANLSGLDLRGGVFPMLVVDRHKSVIVQGVNFSGADLRGVCLRLGYDEI